QAALRCFELDLLGQLGYEVVLDQDADAGAPINPDAYYRYQAQIGFAPVVDGADIAADPAVIQGQRLQCIQRRDFTEPQTRRAAKYITRQALQEILGDKPLISRKMLGSR
ncbi:MAG TPA: DNA repair protein RecO, partial [Gammaproteobacteria bacterium]|nr:DNA repair protein RecO [Gammaproteobacteria bacterium]